MKIVKIIPFESFIFEKGKYRSISNGNHVEWDNKYLIYMNRSLAGSISVAESEIKKIIFRVGIDENYVLDKTLKILEKQAAERKIFKFYIYSDTKHIPHFEKLGFIKRKRFFDANDDKYFKMFKII